MATSAISGSGSLVVRCCSISPGLLNSATILLSLFPARRMISYDTPAMTGIRSRRITTRSTGEDTRINRKKIILTIMTNSKKLVPQRLCSLELFITFSTFSSSPCSTQLIHLCSAPWYINTRWISFILEISTRYPRNRIIRTHASATAISPSDVVTCRRKFARK